MEAVVACFLKKYFTFLAEQKVQATKELYAENAIVSLTLNGQTEKATGSALVEKVIALFANGTTTITDVQVSSSPDAVTLSADGFVDMNGVQSTFSQQATLFCVAKHWFVGFEQVTVTIPEAVEEVAAEVVEEPIAAPATPEPEPVVVKKEATPKKEKKAAAVEKAAPAAAPAAPVVEAPKPAAPKPAVSGWAAVAASAPTGEKPRATVIKTSSPVAVEKPVSKVVLPTLVCVHFAITGSNTIFEKTDPSKHKELVAQDLFPLMEKVGITKDDVKDFRVIIPSPTNIRTNVFVDFTIADAFERLQTLQSPTIKGVRITFVLSTKK